MKTLTDGQKKPASQKKKTSRKTPSVLIGLDEAQIEWLEKHVANRSKYIRQLISTAMLLPRPEDFVDVINRHIKTKLLEFNAIKRASRD